MTLIQPLEDIYLYNKYHKEDGLVLRILAGDIIVATDKRGSGYLKEYKICIGWISARHFQEVDKLEYLKEIGYNALYNLTKKTND